MPVFFTLRLPRIGTTTFPHLAHILLPATPSLPLSSLRFHSKSHAKNSVFPRFFRHCLLKRMTPPVHRLLKPPQRFSVLSFLPPLLCALKKLKKAYSLSYYYFQYQNNNTVWRNLEFITPSEFSPEKY